MQERFPEAMEMVEAALGLAREQHRTLCRCKVNDVCPIAGD